MSEASVGMPTSTDMLLLLPLIVVLSLLSVGLEAALQPIDRDIKVHSQENLYLVFTESIYSHDPSIRSHRGT